MGQVDAVLARLDSAEAEIRARYFDFLRIPSVSAQPAHAADCRRAAEWLVRELAERQYFVGAVIAERQRRRVGPRVYLSAMPECAVSDRPRPLLGMMTFRRR